MTEERIPTAGARARARWGLFLGIAATVVILDQASKAWLVGQLGPGERLEILGDWLRIVHGQNTGALFGLFQDQALLFGLVSIGVIALIVWYHGSSGRNTLLSVALGLLLGGAIGNMLDRLRLGYVVDWVDIGIGDWRFYTFNVADSAISCSILLLILIALLPPRRSAEAAETGAASTTPAAGAATSDADPGPNGAAASGVVDG
jgi:signal peptidase II